MFFKQYKMWNSSCVVYSYFPEFISAPCY